MVDEVIDARQQKAPSRERQPLAPAFGPPQDGIRGHQRAAQVRQRGKQGAQLQHQPRIAIDQHHVAAPRVVKALGGGAREMVVPGSPLAAVQCPVNCLDVGEQDHVGLGCRARQDAAGENAPAREPSRPAAAD